MLLARRCENSSSKNGVKNQRENLFSSLQPHPHHRKVAILSLFDRSFDGICLNELYLLYSRVSNGNLYCYPLRSSSFLSETCSI